MTTKEVAKLTGASLRQLQYWVEEGLIPVKIKGHSREWAIEDLRMADAILKLRRKRLSFRQIRRLQKKLFQQVERRPIIGPLYLVTDGRDVTSTVFSSTVSDWALSRTRSVFVVQLQERITA